MNTRLLLVLIGLLLFACKPTAGQKAQIAKMYFECMLSITHKMFTQDTVEDFLAASTRVDETFQYGISEKSWSVSGDKDEIITMSFVALEANDLYECDFVERASKDSNWTLQEARRNNAVTFNLEEDIIVREKLEKLRAALKEAELMRDR
jgi:hypothetical protein